LIVALAPPAYLVDTSALSRMRHPAVSAVLTPLLATGLVAHCGVLDLEVLFSARSHADLVATRRRLHDGFLQVDLLQADFDRAIDVMELLAEAGKHRSASLPDLLLAAVAERAALTVVHYDADFDHIAGVTRQLMQWVVPAGSVP
jgi:predicted nucleic acid-binding protein